MRYAEAMWEIAYKHESYLGAEMVLDELLEILRLDYFDHFNASHMAVFMFLYLGNQQIVLKNSRRIPIFFMEQNREYSVGKIR